MAKKMDFKLGFSLTWPSTKKKLVISDYNYFFLKEKEDNIR